MSMLYKILFLFPLASMAVPSAPSSNLGKRSITCLTVGQSATATWTNSAGQTCSFVGVVGSNYGANSAGNGDDPNCGNAYNAAVDDFAGGLVAGCSQTNPTSSASPPNSGPVCA
ncbi:hypothetical protein ABOM_005584 [Aspergillus bombycis]|uniref:DUF8213 domain-containing protein n=1 Tax=Aspergillus bombycis TaxID=109264 RepID=A0A1F8A0V5_9EURO|nr:hypothetical protein ABOM_005584 [Aspergillus bombycis]OGM45362.1 hypothetical protein ABOM_005584 [Aspergillus bombycis]